MNVVVMLAGDGGNFVKDGQKYPKLHLKSIQCLALEN